MTKEIILEDKDVFLLMPQKAITKGHMILVPKEKYLIMEAVPPELLKKMFQTANKISTILFETMNCHGTNILIQNGEPAGQTNPNFSINIIPRYENDGLKLDWTPKPAPPEDLEETMNSFKGTEEKENQEKYLQEQKEKVSQKKEEEIIEENDEKENYLTKSLIRHG
ncbi:HIT family protein [Candidatus Woesearchaeota archaeon]|nr:HIT family protein [Candidatus Woesearchaeota archaeon]MCF7901510.1 HIT family protein [Candidatus Woesearchaeota archaeon]MCF8013939.1 HIT family protein [Candidatus Woesearchaeota archaeon]